MTEPHTTPERSQDHACQKWRAFLSTVRVGGALPISFEVVDGCACRERCPDRSTHIRASMIVPHVGSPEPDPTATRFPVRLAKGLLIPVERTTAVPQWTDQADASEWVRCQVIWFYRHEAEEQIEIDGVRVFEPKEDHT